MLEARVRQGDTDERVVTLVGEGLKRVVPLAVGSFGDPPGERLIALLRTTRATTSRCLPSTPAT